MNMTEEELARANAKLDEQLPPVTDESNAAASGPEATAANIACQIGDRVILVSGSELTPEPVQWLWRDWLALGKLHILAGSPGEGKTSIAIAMAATVTTGGQWPDGSHCPAGNVLVWSGEDDPADTLLPRLIAAGGDRSRVFFVTGARIRTRVEAFDFARDLPALQAQAKRIGDVRFIIIDPVVSAITGDSHKNTEVRRALQPLVDMAASMDAALLGVTHFSKGGQGQDPASRLAGSIAFPAVARVVFVAAKAKTGEGEDRRILARCKSNIGPDGDGFTYRIDQCEPLPGIHASRVIWGAAVPGTARELLDDAAEQDGSRSAVEFATEFLMQVLAGGTVPSKNIEAEAKAAGVSWASVRRASSMLGVVKRKGADGWYWELSEIS